MPAKGPLQSVQVFGRKVSERAGGSAPGTRPRSPARQLRPLPGDRGAVSPASPGGARRACAAREPQGPPRVSPEPSRAGRPVAPA